MSQRTLYLHIGCHKTGTTSIQHTLAENTEALAARGLTYFYRNRRTGENRAPRLHSWLRPVDEESLVPRGMGVAEPERLAQELAGCGGDVVVSSENFSFLFEEERIAELYAPLAAVFDDIRVICYLRRQDRHVVSHHQEGAKPFRKPEYDLFGYSPRAIPPWDPAHDLYLDYHRRLSRWAGVFGKESLALSVFDRALLRDGDVVSDFLHILGVTDFDRIADHNVSLGLPATKLGHLVKQPGTRRQQLLWGSVEQREQDALPMRPSRATARAYYERYAESNRRLEAEFRVTGTGALFDDDFSEYPDLPEDLWTEETANQAVRRLVEAFDALGLSELSADDLRDAALAIGPTKPEVAVKLLRIAVTLRPDGPLINRKLAEFEAAVATPDGTE